MPCILRQCKLHKYTHVASYGAIKVPIVTEECPSMSMLSVSVARVKEGHLWRDSRPQSSTIQAISRRTRSGQSVLAADLGKPICALQGIKA